MDAKRWKKRIEKQLSELGALEKAFDPAVSALADILEQADKAYDEFINTGEGTVVAYTNKGGATNEAKNPRLVAWMDLRKLALEHWRELGLTPSSFRKMRGETAKKEKPAGLAAALLSLES